MGECVLAEITPALSQSNLKHFLDDWKIQFLPSTSASATMAGQMFRTYLERQPGEKRVLPDFLIGAHALHHTGRLLARDRRYFRDHFSKLTVIDPS